jgi:sugar lactone lactonase YvrE
LDGSATSNLSVLNSIVSGNTINVCASFSNPMGVVYSSVNSNIYVSAGNAIRQISPSGQVSTVSTGFNNPAALCLDTQQSNLYIADTGNNAIKTLVLLTSNVSTFASGLSGPQGITCDTSNIYVADTNNHVLKQYVISNSNMTYLAGSNGCNAYVSGIGSTVRFNSPRGLTIDSNFSNLYIADFSNYCVRQCVISSATVSTYAGTPQASGYNSFSFAGPSSLTLNSNGTLYISDSGNNAIIYTTSPKVKSIGATSNLLTTSAAYQMTMDNSGNLYTVLNAATARIVKRTPAGITTSNALSGVGYISGLAIDSTNTYFYVSGNTSNRIWRVAVADYSVTIFAGNGSGGFADGNGTNAQFNLGVGGSLTMDASNNIYVLDTNNSRIRKITPSADVTTVASSISIAGNYSGMTMDLSGNFYFSSTASPFRLSKISAGVQSNFTANNATGSDDGPLATAKFGQPFYSMCCDSSGNVWFSERYPTGQCRIRYITPAGYVTTFKSNIPYSDAQGLLVDTVGNVYAVFDAAYLVKYTVENIYTNNTFIKTTTGYIDGLATAKINYPLGIFFQSSNLLLADMSNYSIRTIATNSNITTYAGNAINSTFDANIDSNMASNFSVILAVAYSSVNSNIYVSAANNLYQITSAGVVSTLSSGFNAPLAICIDTTATNIYIADTGNNAIKKLVLSTSNVTTFASGLSGPQGIVCDTTNLYVSDTGNHVLKQYVISNSNMTYLAGSNRIPGSAVGTGSTARFNIPKGLAIDSNYTNIYIADYGNYAVKQCVISSGSVSTYAGTPTISGFDSTHLAGPSYVALNGSTLYIADTVNNAIVSFVSSLTTVATLNPGPITSLPSALLVVDTASNFIRSVNYATSAVGSYGGVKPTYLSGGLFQTLSLYSNSLYTVANSGSTSLIVQLALSSPSTYTFSSISTSLQIQNATGIPLTIAVSGGIVTNPVLNSIPNISDVKTLYNTGSVYTIY